MMERTILIVEDDHALSSGIKLSIQGNGIFAEQAFSIMEAQKKLEEETIDLVLLDINLPDGDGMNLLKRIKNNQRKIPVIFLTANDLETDVVAGLESGADDYITKPFSLAILRARVNTALRKNYEKNSAIVFGGLQLDFDGMCFYKDGRELILSKTEQKLLRLLVENRGRTLSRTYLIDRLWSDGAEFVDENALSVTIKRLRKKIEADPKNPRQIKTVYGIGYQWES